VSGGGKIKPVGDPDTFEQLVHASDVPEDITARRKIARPVIAGGCDVSVGRHLHGDACLEGFAVATMAFPGTPRT
jgi:hypothetical protein